ncbi:MAG: winged helix-turn-helix domain-containing protein [Longimicrobiales bacterium]
MPGQTVWSFNCRIDTRRVDFQVTTLREKMEADPAHPRHLLTVRGVGYRLLA